MDSPVWFITGASSGFGLEIAKEALARGHRVIATARNPSKLSSLASAGADVMALDVRADEAAVASAVDEAFALHGKITHVVNSAGYALEADVEEASAQEAADHASAPSSTLAASAPGGAGPRRGAVLRDQGRRVRRRAGLLPHGVPEPGRPHLGRRPARRVRRGTLWRVQGAHGLRRQQPGRRPGQGVPRRRRRHDQFGPCGGEEDTRETGPRDRLPRCYTEEVQGDVGAAGRVGTRLWVD
ncbi:Oxidoreductase BOA17 [Colletotrichum sidae]|uniref:Oxidoreductase BOA17 n=1 Tax=Colletotrichum sidae TaxID=1347389 RepID=A0A4R8T1T0_9PEZI|nr:Oxidoreductase BOA17 [Colletotrichum sidae]